VSHPVSLLGAARAELWKAVEYYDEQLPGLGDEFAAEVERTLRQLQVFPELGSPGTAETRRVPLRRFPFHVIYRIRSGGLVIVAVAHQRRKPEYWMKRRPG
jgi:toxin ParE2